MDNNNLLVLERALMSTMMRAYPLDVISKDTLIDNLWKMQDMITDNEKQSAESCSTD